MAAFNQLWSDFHKKSSDRLKGVYQGDIEDLELIIWNCNQTRNPGILELPTDQYAIQIWTNGSDVEVSTGACYKFVSKRTYR